MSSTKTITWRCSRKSLPCNVYVLQRISAGIDFDVQYGQEDFNLKNADVDGNHLSHQPIAGKGDQKRLVAVCKDMAISNIYRTAGQIVRDVFNNNMNVEPVRKANIVRTTNAARQRRRPTPPAWVTKIFALTSITLGPSFSVESLRRR